MEFDPRSATAIIVEESTAGQGAVGSGVFLKVNQATIYLVTAAHVAANPTGRTLVRMSLKSGEVDDVPVDQWFRNSDKHEVAVARMSLSPEDYQFGTVPIDARSSSSVTLAERRVSSRHLEGQEVFLVGAYPKIPAMANQNRTMIRSGLLASTWQDGVPVLNRAKRTELTHTVHLIDCYAHAGFSGSPCFTRFFHSPNVGKVAERRRRLSGDMSIGGTHLTAEDAVAQGRMGRVTWNLMGILLGHFPHTEKTFDIGELHPGFPNRNYSTAESRSLQQAVNINAGIGLVVPVAYIIDTLMQSDVVAEREEIGNSGGHALST